MFFFYILNKTIFQLICNSNRLMYILHFLNIYKKNNNTVVDRISIIGTSNNPARRTYKLYLISRTNKIAVRIYFSMLNIYH